MNILIAVLFCVSAVFALPAPQTTPIPNLALNIYGPTADGSYSYNYETGNGIQVQEQGQLVRTADGKEDALYVQGAFSYPDPDGRPISLSYVANENGFQPSGAHLPVGPPVPPEIIRALEYIAQHPEEDNL